MNWTGLIENDATRGRAAPIAARDGRGDVAPGMSRRTSSVAALVE